jgi:hypothetical protein
MPAAGTTKDWDSRLGITETLEQQIAAEAVDSGPTVEAASFDANNIKELARADVNMLAGLAMPTVFQFLYPPVLLAAWQLLVESVKKPRNFAQIALGIPRGHGKTTLIKLFILYCILFTDRKFILIIGSTATLAENILADVFDMLEEPNIVRLFGNWVLGKELQRQDLVKMGFRGRNITVAAIGAGGSIRGMNVKNERPDVMVFDDVQTKECSESEVMSKSLERWMIGTAMKAKSPHGCLFIFCGNMYPGPNSILKKLKSNPNWIKFISGAILADNTALWPQLRPLKDLLAELDNDIAMGHPEIFFSEVLNDTEAGINNKVDISAIKQWPWAEHERPQAKVILVDPSANKKGGDDVAIGYVEVYDGKCGLREVVEKKLSPGNTIRQALIMALRTGTRVIAVESTAYQYSLLYWFGYICNELGITGIECVDLYSGSHSKNSRITEMLKALTQGEAFVHDSIRNQVAHQIANWNPLKRDNVDGILDLLTYMPRALELYGYAMATEVDPHVIEASGTEVLEFNSSF